MAEFYKVAAKAEAELFDGTDVGAAAIVALYPDVVSIQSAEDEGEDAVLAVIKDDGSIQNAYKNDYIVFISEMDKAPFEVYKTQVWAQTWFEKYFISVGN